MAMMKALKSVALVGELMLALHGDVHPRHAELHIEPRKAVAGISR